MRCACLGAAAAFIGVWGCAKGDAQRDVAPRAVAPVLRAEVITIEPSGWPAIVRTQGTLYADEFAVVGTKVAGRVAEAHVELGDRVRAGAPLVSLDPEEFRLQVKQAEAQLTQARAAVGLGPQDSLDKLNPEDAPPVREEKALWDEARAKSIRWQQLKTQNAVTEADLEQVLAAEQVAQARHASAINSVNEKIALISVRGAELSLARQRLADAVVRAPFDGLVADRQAAPGAYRHIGDPIASVVRTNPLHFRGTISERHARLLAIGQEVELQIESIDAPRLVRVTRISPSLDRLSRSLLFEAEVSNGDGKLRSGLFAEAMVEIEPRARAISVPSAAVVEFAGVEKVWKVVAGTAQEQVVLTGARREGRIEIREGLAAGDVILAQGDEGRTAPVEIVPSSEPLPSDQTAADTRRPLAEAQPSRTEVSGEAAFDEAPETGGP